MIALIRIAVVTAFVLLTMPASAQSLEVDTHRTDSIMQRIEMQFTRYRPFRFLDDDDLESVVIVRKPASASFDPNVRNFKVTFMQGPSNLFTTKDDIMWAKDFTFSNFATDFLFSGFW